MKINGNITLNPFGQSEIQNMFVERLSAIPAHNASDKGRLIYNLTDNTFYLNDGSTWVSVATGGNAALLNSELDSVEAALGFLNANGTINASTLQALGNVDNTATTLLAALQQIDAAISGQDQFSELSDVNLVGLVDKQFIQYDGTSGKWVVHTPVLADISDVLASVSEVNFLVGVTSGVQAQINAEAGTRQAADTALQGAIDAEATARSNSDIAMQAELDDTQVGAGLTAVGGYKTRTTANYLNPAVDLHDADTILDTQVKAINDSHSAFVTAQNNRDNDQDAAIAARLPLAGGTMSGSVIMSAGTHVTIPDAPINGTDATNKAYVDSTLSGLSWKEPVDTVVATIAGFAALLVGQRALALDDNKIYTSTGSAWDAGVLPADGWSTFNRADESGYVFSGTSWVQFSGAGQVVDGIGLRKTGNVLDINMGAGITELPSDEIGIDVLGTGGLFTTIDGVLSSSATSAQLSVKRDGTDATFGHTLTTGADGIRVAQVVVNKINANQLAISNETSSRQQADTNMQAEIDATQVGAGLEVTGAYPQNAGANFIAGVTSLAAADDALDAALKAEQVARVAADAGLTTSVTDEASARVIDVNALHDRVAAGYFLYENLTPTTSHVVTHSIGSRYCTVTIIDAATNEQVIPQSVVFDSATQLTVTFNAALACRIVVMGLAPRLA